MERLWIKQVKTIENQSEKQIKSIAENEIQPAETNILVKKNDFDTYYSEKDSSLFLRQKEIFNKLYNKSFKKIEHLSNKTDRNDLIYKYKFDKEVNFDEIIDPIIFLIK